MKDIAIFGAGGFGREVACLIEQIDDPFESEIKQYHLIGFFDDGVPAGTQISRFGKVIGGMGELNQWETPLSVVIAIGDTYSLHAVQQRITNKNIDFPNLIHPSFGTADIDSFHIGKGNIIQGGCYASCDTRIGDFNILNGSVVMGHDAIIGNFNVIMPAVRISGEVKIGNGNFFGVGSIVLQQLKIGNDVRLGAGSVLMTKPKNGNLYIGVPAKKTEF